MFRKMSRVKQALTEEESRQLLAEGERAFIGLNGDDGYPYVLPINYYYDPEDGKAYIHGARVGHIIDAMNANNKVCFTIVKDSHKDEDGWFWYVKSVVAFGRTELVTDEAKRQDILRKIGKKYFPATPEGETEIEETMRKSAAHAHVTSITFEHISGKLVHER